MFNVGKYWELREELRKSERDPTSYFSQTDQQFLKTFRLTKMAVITLLDLLHLQLPDQEPPTRLEILTTLHYYATGKLDSVEEIIKGMVRNVEETDVNTGGAGRRQLPIYEEPSREDSELEPVIRRNVKPNTGVGNTSSFAIWSEVEFDYGEGEQDEMWENNEMRKSGPCNSTITRNVGPRSHDGGVGEMLMGGSAELVQGIHIISSIICEALGPLYLTFPSDTSGLKAEFLEKARLEGVVGCVASVNVQVAIPQGIEFGMSVKNFGMHNIRLIGVFGADGRVNHILAHNETGLSDWQIFHKSDLCNVVNNGLLDGMLLVDNTYPHLKYIQPPLPYPSSKGEEFYNYYHSHTMQIGLKSFEQIFARFPCLFIGMDPLFPNNLPVLTACCILHNLCLRYGYPQPPLFTDLLQSPPTTQHTIREPHSRKK